MTAVNLPPVDVLRKLLECDPEAGTLTWRTRTPDMFVPSANRSAGHACRIWNAKYAGTVAGGAHNRGYRHLTLVLNGRKRSILIHRIMWVMHYGAEPFEEIDHINGIRDDNRIANLRDVSKSTNMRNSRMPRNNTSGVVGVYKTPNGKWMAKMTWGGRQASLGTFEHRFDAILARFSAERNSGFTSRHGS
jgi:hypothetical protein